MTLQVGHLFFQHWYSSKCYNKNTALLKNCNEAPSPTVIALDPTFSQSEEAYDRAKMRERHKSYDPEVELGLHFLRCILLSVHSTASLQADMYASIKIIFWRGEKVMTFFQSLRQGIRRLLNWWKAVTLRKVRLLFNIYTRKAFWYLFAESTGLTYSNCEPHSWVR